MSFLNPIRIAPLAETMTRLEKERERIAFRRDALLTETQQFENVLNRILEPWIGKKDPVTGRYFIAVEDVDGEPWGKRLRFYNKHFVEFKVSNDGVLSMTTSCDGRTQVFDAGMRLNLNQAQNAGTFVLQRAEGDETVGTPLASILDEQIAAATDMPDLVEDEDEDGK